MAVEILYAGDSETDIELWMYLRDKLPTTSHREGIYRNYGDATWDVLRTHCADGALNVMHTADFRPGTPGYALHLAHLHERAQLVERRMGIRPNACPPLEKLLDAYRLATYEDGMTRIRDAADLPRDLVDIQTLRDLDHFARALGAIELDLTKPPTRKLVPLERIGDHEMTNWDVGKTLVRPEQFLDLSLQ